MQKVLLYRALAGWCVILLFDIFKLQPPNAFFFPSYIYIYMYVFGSCCLIKIVFDLLVPKFPVAWAGQGIKEACGGDNDKPGNFRKFVNLAS